MAVRLCTYRHWGETMAAYSSDALDVLLDEVRRDRDLQSTRIDSLRNRAGIQIGASGIAAGLVASIADNALWLWPIGAFLLAAVFGVLTIMPRSGHMVEPLALFEQAEGERAIQVKANVITAVLSEFQLQESMLRWPAITTRIGTALFLIGIALVALVAILTVIA